MRAMTEAKRISAAKRVTDFPHRIQSGRKR